MSEASEVNPVERLVSCNKLERQRREEIRIINARYKKLKKKVREGCECKYGEWKPPANMDFRFDLMGKPIYYRTCTLCGNREMKKGN